jgi:hypothetical protein
LTIAKKSDRSRGNVNDVVTLNISRDQFPPTSPRRAEMPQRGIRADRGLAKYDT